MHFHHRLAENVLRELGDPGEYVVDERLVLGEMLPPFLSDFIDFLPALLRSRRRVSQILEHRERRIYCPRTRRIHPAEALLDLLDDLVTVPRLFVEQAENHELELGLIEHPS